MKRNIGLAALIAVLATAVMVPLANAQCVSGTGTNILLKWDANGFSYEGPSAYTGYLSPAGNVLTNVLAVTLLCSPLNALDPNNAALEYTMVWNGLVSGGTTTAPFGASGTKYTTLYTGGSFTLYEGPVNARPYTSATVPLPGVALPQYAEGTVILSGPIDSLTTVITQSSSGSVNGSFRGKYTVTGGTYQNQFCGGGGIAALMDGLWYPVAPPAGYTGHSNGKFDSADCTTPTGNTSWGRIKTLYR
jgi:hypothetical protein